MTGKIEAGSLKGLEMRYIVNSLTYTNKVRKKGAEVNRCGVVCEERGGINIRLESAKAIFDGNTALSFNHHSFLCNVTKRGFASRHMAYGRFLTLCRAQPRF